MENVIPILSLVVAALAVFVGPFISSRIARKQVMSSLEVANKQITAPMRQAWINSLRDLLAELSSSALHYYVSGFEDRRDQEYQRLSHLEHKVQLMLNPKEEDHKKLEQLIHQMIASIERGKEGDNDFAATHPAVMELSRQVLKREWNRVKAPIELA
jgi:hypothetical protein